MCDDHSNSDQQKSTISTDVISGMASGAIYSLLFNPWDRALYLSMKHNRSFLKRDNFAQPYQGAIQAMTNRMFFGSIYYIAQGQMRSSLAPYLHDVLGFEWPLVHSVTGFSAGVINGFLTNAPSLIKAHTWGNNKGTFQSSIVEMYQSGGMGAFSRGLLANVLTDSIRGSSYELFRHVLRNKVTEYRKERDEQSRYIDFFCDATAAFAGTVLAAPMNYARIQKYSVPPSVKAPTITGSLKSVWAESKEYNNSISKKLGFFQSRFCIKVSTLRAAAGMAVGQMIVNEMRVRLKS